MPNIPGLGLWVGRRSLQKYWAPLTLVVEDAAPTHVVITFPSAKTVSASDFTIAGFTVSSGSWTGSVYTLVLSTAVVYGDSLTVVYATKSYSVTNNVAWTHLTDLVLNYTGRSGLVLTEASGLNAAILPSAGLCDANNYLNKTVADFAFGDASGYLECRFYYDGGSTGIQLFASGDEASAKYITFNVYSGKPRLTIANGGSSHLVFYDTALGVGWHTVRFISAAGAYGMNIDGSPVAINNYSGTDNGEWFASVTARDNVSIGVLKTNATYAGTNTYIDYVDYNGANQWILSGFGNYEYDIIGGLHMTWTGSTHVKYIDGAGQYLMNTGYSTWKKVEVIDEYVPYASANTPYDPSAFLTNYYKDKDYAGSTTGFNKAPALIGFNESSSADGKLTIFDRSNTTRQTLISRALFSYDSTNLATKSRYHSTEIYNTKTFESLFCNGYQFCIYPIQNDATTPRNITGISVYSDNRTQSEHDNTITFTNNKKEAVWHPQGTILEATVAGEEGNVFEPVVIYEGNAQVIATSGNVFKMWYTGGWNTSNIYYAESLTGLAGTWQKYATPLLTDTKHGFMLKRGSTYYYFAHRIGAAFSWLQIDLYSCNDGINFTLATANILHVGAAGQWDDTIIGRVTALDDGATVYLFYDAAKSTNYVNRTGFASTTDMVTWTKYASNPVFSPYTRFKVIRGDTFIKKSGSNYYLWCVGNYDQEWSGAGTPTDIFRYRSPDLHNWFPDSDGFALNRRTADEGINNLLGQVADTNIVEVNGICYHFYSATPDGQNYTGPLHIKLATANMTFDQLVLTNEGNAV